MVNVEEDAYGHEVYAYWQSLCDPDIAPPHEIIERDDGWIGVSSNTPQLYFLDYASWPQPEKDAIQHADGKILDIGCGAGRVGLYLQDRGLYVLGIDTSPLAIEVCELRGLSNVRVMSITQVSSRLGSFDTIVMFGNNFGLFGNQRRARFLLRRFFALTPKSGKIIATSNNPYKTRDPGHLAYHEYNRNRGRMPGQLRLRVRYQARKSPWFDYLLVSPDEMITILRGTGWRVANFFHQDEKSVYSALIVKSS